MIWNLKFCSIWKGISVLSWLEGSSVVVVKWRTCELEAPGSSSAWSTLYFVGMSLGKILQWPSLSLVKLVEIIKWTNSPISFISFILYLCLKALLMLINLVLTEFYHSITPNMFQFILISSYWMSFRNVENLWHDLFKGVARQQRSVVYDMALWRCLGNPQTLVWTYRHSSRNISDQWENMSSSSQRYKGKCAFSKKAYSCLVLC